MADLSVCVRRRRLRSDERLSRMWHKHGAIVLVYRYGVPYGVRKRDVRVGDMVKADADEQGVHPLVRVTGWDDA